VAVLALLVALWTSIADAQVTPTTPATVTHVVDGDTVDVQFDVGTIERLRLIGLDSPEVVDPRKPVQCFGREASAHAHALLDGQTVQVERDASQGERDVYGRLLAYVWLPDGRNFAEIMLEDGYGHEYTYRTPYAYRDSFLAAEGASRDNQLGLWSPATCNGDTTRPAEVLPAAPATGGLLGADDTAPPLAAAQPPTRQPTDASWPCLEGQIKANRNSGIYHVPAGQSSARTRANVECFDTEEQARTGGFRRALRQ
jgi:endonuclease YncB( thermonuclease family)